MSDEIATNSVTTEPAGVGDAVGVEKRYWFAAIVNHNTEKASAEKLEKIGYKCYVASQEEYRVWKNGRRAKINRVVISSILFVCCTEKERLTIVEQPYILRFLTNKASEPNQFGKPIAIIPDNQIKTLQFMLGNSESPISFIDRVYDRGDKVIVVRGKLRGLEGIVHESNEGRSTLSVNINCLGCASLTINPTDVAPLN